MPQEVGVSIQEGTAVGLHGRAHKVPQPRPVRSVFAVSRREGLASPPVRAPLTPRPPAGRLQRGGSARWYPSYPLEIQERLKMARHSVDTYDTACAVRHPGTSLAHAPALPQSLSLEGEV
jgi:hypothetical protein